MTAFSPESCVSLWKHAAMSLHQALMVCEHFPRAQSAESTAPGPHPPLGLGSHLALAGVSVSPAAAGRDSCRITFSIRS